MMTFSYAEGLVIQGGSIHGTGLAFLSSDLTIHAPVYTGDTITVVVEVTEQRPTSKGGRGVVTTRNRVVNQDGVVVMTYTPARLTRAATVTCAGPNVCSGLHRLTVADADQLAGRIGIFTSDTWMRLPGLITRR